MNFLDIQFIREYFSLSFRDDSNFSNFENNYPRNWRLRSRIMGWRLTLSDYLLIFSWFFTGNLENFYSRFRLFFSFRKRSKTILFATPLISACLISRWNRCGTMWRDFEMIRANDSTRASGTIRDGYIPLDWRLILNSPISRALAY